MTTQNNTDSKQGEALEPCACKSAVALRYDVIEVGNWIQVVCGGCGRRGAHGGSHWMAAKLWNQDRASVAAVEGDAQAKAKAIVEEYKQRVIQLPSGDAVPCAKWLEMRLRIAFDLAAASSPAPAKDRCEHGVLWSMECLSCGLPEYVATPPDTPSDAAMRAAEEIVKAIPRLQWTRDINAAEEIAAIITRNLAAKSETAVGGEARFVLLTTALTRIEEVATAGECATTGDAAERFKWIKERAAALRSGDES